MKRKTSRYAEMMASALEGARIRYIRELEAMVADRGRERDAAQEAAGRAERELSELEERTREFEAHEAQTHETMRECWSAIGVKEDAFHVMPAFIRNLQAHSAAMREALGDALKFIAVTPWPGNAPWTHDRLNRLFEAGQAALSGDAGRAMLERVEALELVADAARRCRDSDDEDRVSEFDAMSAALDALEPKR